MLPDDLAKVLGSKTRVVLYSDETADKMRTKHPEVTPDVLPRLDDLLRNGEVLKQAGRRTVVVYKEYDDYNWVAAVKVTEKADELYLTTYYRASRRYLDKLVHRSETVR